MKKIYLILLLFAAHTATAQPELFQVFGRRYTPLQFPRMVSATEQGEFWAVCEIAEGGENDILLARLDSTGGLVFADTLGELATESHILDFKRDSLTGALWLLTLRESFISGYAPKAIFVIKFDETGQFLFEKSIAEAMHGYVQPLPDGGIAVAASNDTSVQLSRLTENGVQVWQKALSGGSKERDLDQLSAGASGMLFWTSYDAANQQVDLRAFNLSDGADLWQRPINALPDAQISSVGSTFDPIDSTVITLHQTYIANGFRYVFTKINTQGALMWQTELPTRQFQQGPSQRLFVDADSSTFTLLNSGGYVRCSRDSGNVVSEYDFYWLPLSSSQEEWSDGFFVDSTQLVAVGRLDGAARFIRFQAADSTFLAQNDFSGLAPRLESEGSAVMAIDTSGNYFVANVQDFEGENGFDVILRKFSPSGDFLLQKTFIAPALQRPEALLRLQDNQLLLLSSSDYLSDTGQLILQKINPQDGAIIWEKRRQQPLSTGYDLQALAMPDGGAVAVFTRQFKLPNGEKVNHQTCAIRFTAQGDTLWAARYLPDANAAAAQIKKRRFTDLERVPDGSLLAIGEVEMAHGFGLRFNAENGQQIAAFEVNPGIFQDARLNTVLPISTTEAIVHANPRRIMRISTLTGQVLHFEFLYFNNGASQSAHLFRTPDGRVMGLFGNIPYHPDSKGFRVVEIRENDLSILSNTELRTENLLMTDALLLSDCGLAAVGPYRDSDNNADLFITKIAPVCTPVAVSNPEELPQEMDVFPNPLPEATTLHIVPGGDFSGKIMFECFSLTGQRLAFMQQEKTAELQVFEWKNVPGTGPFLLRISDGKNVAMRLVVR